METTDDAADECLKETNKHEIQRRPKLVLPSTRAPCLSKPPTDFMGADEDFVIDLSNDEERENSQAKKQTNLDQWLAVRTKVKQKTDGTPKVEQHRVGVLALIGDSESQSGSGSAPHIERRELLITENNDDVYNGPHLHGYAKRTALRQQLLSDITKRRHDEQQKRFQAFEEEVGDTEQKEDNDEDEPEESDGDFEPSDNSCSDNDDDMSREKCDLLDDEAIDEEDDANENILDDVEPNAQEEPVKLSEHLDETSNANNDNNDHRNTNSPSHNISLSSLLNNDEPQQPDANHSPIRHLSPVRVFDDVNDDDFLNLSPVKQQNQPTTPVPPLCDLPDTLSQLLRRPKSPPIPLLQRGDSVNLLCSGVFPTQIQNDDVIPHTHNVSPAKFTLPSIVETRDDENENMDTNNVLIQNDPDHSDDDDVVKKSTTINPKKKHPVVLLDDDNESDDDETVEETDIEDDDSVDSEDDDCVMNSSDDEEGIVRQIYQQSQRQENGGGGDEKKAMKRPRQRFVEEEAELSGSDVGSGDEDEGDEKDNNYEAEAGDLDALPSEEQMESELHRIHQKRLLDDDAKQLRVIKEALLPDGELHSDAQRLQWRFNRDQQATNFEFDAAALHSRVDDGDENNDDEIADQLAKHRIALVKARMTTSKSTSNDSEDVLPASIFGTNNLLTSCRSSIIHSTRDDTQSTSHLQHAATTTSLTHTHSLRFTLLTDDDDVASEAWSTQPSTIHHQPLRDSFLHRDADTLDGLLKSSSARNVNETSKSLFTRIDSPTKENEKKKKTVMLAKKRRLASEDSNSNSVFAFFK